MESHSDLAWTESPFLAVFILERALPAGVRGPVFFLAAALRCSSSFGVRLRRRCKRGGRGSILAPGFSGALSDGMRSSANDLVNSSDMTPPDFE